MPFVREDYGLRPAMADTAPPSTTNVNWPQFSLVENRTPAVGAPISWLNTGSAWVPTGILQDPGTVTTVAAASSVANTASIVDINTGGFNITLAVPVTTSPGTQIALINDNASPCTLVAGSGAAIVGNVTLAANTSATVVSSGTTWYRT